MHSSRGCQIVCQTFRQLQHGQVGRGNLNSFVSRFVKTCRQNHRQIYRQILSSNLSSNLIVNRRIYCQMPLSHPRPAPPPTTTAQPTPLHPVAGAQLVKRGWAARGDHLVAALPLPS